MTKARIQEAPMQELAQLPQTTFMWIDAATAVEFLKKERPPQAGVKGTNRKSGPNVIREYAGAMLRGEWVLTHQGIAFNEADEMIDGGHRMRAVVVADAEKPGIRIPFMVTFGIAPEAMVAMDLGKRRVPSDFLGMNGEVNTSALAGVLRMAYCYYNVPWVHTESWARHRITPTMQEMFLDENPLLREAVYETFPLKRLFKASASGAFWFIAKTERPDIEVQDFMEELRSGELLAKGDPALTLRELMLTSRADGRRYEAAEELALLIKAFNRRIRGQESRMLAFRNTENFPRITDFGL